MTFIDHATKIAQAEVIPATEVETLWKAFYSRWLAIFGSPWCLLTDQGSGFTSKVFSKHLSSLGIRQAGAGSHHPEGNGQIEA